MGGHAGGFGSAEKVVRVGDVVELGWDGGNVGAAGEKDGWREKLGNGTREERVVRLRCSVCSLGVKDGQSVGDACENCECPVCIFLCVVSSLDHRLVRHLLHLIPLRTGH